MPSIEITERQAALFVEVSSALHQAEREFKLVATAILAGHDVTQAADLELVDDPGEKPLLVYRTPTTEA